jgi:thermostable 8-oxoguanine DNA glycosylase
MTKDFFKFEGADGKERTLVARHIVGWTYEQTAFIRNTEQLWSTKVYLNSEDPISFVGDHRAALEFAVSP